jgi:hypothetical protein
MHIRPPSSAELESIEATRRAYRDMVGEAQARAHRAFAGSREDIDALDFIDYEAGSHPEGLAGAAVIWGGVLESTGVLSWAVGDEQHWVLTVNPNCRQALIVPYARVAEIQSLVVHAIREVRMVARRGRLALDVCRTRQRRRGEAAGAGGRGAG